MLAELTTRTATIADIPFLAEIQYEASLPPLNQCFWDEILQGTETSARQFIESMLRANACNWGKVEETMILEERGKPVAAATGYSPNLEDYCPLWRSGVDEIARALNWSQDLAIEFRDRYECFWGGDCRPLFLAPQAPWIVENVAVLPQARGRGLGKVLLKALLATGQSQQYSHAGITIVNGNDAARRTYESIGFKPYQTFHAEYFARQFDVDFPGMTKFAIALN